MMTNQVRTIFLQWIPWVLRMARPGEKITRKTIMMQVSVTVAIKVQAIIGGSSVIVVANIDANSDHTVFQNKMKELDLKEKSSKSLLANVLDMDDDYRPSSALPQVLFCQAKSFSNYSLCQKILMPLTFNKIQHNYHYRHNH